MFQNKSESIELESRSPQEPPPSPILPVNLPLQNDSNSLTSLTIHSNPSPDVNGTNTILNLASGILTQLFQSSSDTPLMGPQVNQLSVNHTL